MDANILMFLTGFSVVIFLIGILLGGWVRLGAGWISGGLMVILGMSIWDAGDITTKVLFETTVTTVSLGTGISPENFMILYALMGLLMIVYSTFQEK